MTLISLISKQIWPQVLAVAHLKPATVFLLHSTDATESKGPAQRLKRFFDNSGLVPKGSTRLGEISDSKFNEVKHSLDELLTAHNSASDDWVVNFTGGNKLMANAAFHWSTRHGVRSFYLERLLQMTWFESRNGELETKSEELDGHITDDLNPVALLRCQLDASEVEREGQKLTLNPKGLELSDEEFLKRIQNGNDACQWLDSEGMTDGQSREGDPLEYATAAVLLKLGVRRVQRSLRLKVKSVHGVSTRSPHAELDLLFTWGGRLWIVDCKDRRVFDVLSGFIHEQY